VELNETSQAGCQYFVKRKQRFCKLMATDGSEYCSQHQPAALSAERARVQAEIEAKATGVKEAPKSELNRISATQTRMVNPFARQSERELVLPDWTEVFEDPRKPLLVDIGCARGACLQHLAAREPHWNFVGIEIREVLIDEALAEVKRGQASGKLMRNIHYIAMNCMEEEAFKSLLASWLPFSTEQGGPVAAICVQFPDPWSKSSRQRRRIIGPALCSALQGSDAVRPGCWVYVSSDVPDVVRDGAAVLSEHNFECCGDVSAVGAQLQAWNPEKPTVDADGLLECNPLGRDAPSEREIVCELKWRKVYRVLLVKGTR